MFAFHKKKSMATIKTLTPEEQIVNHLEENGQKFIWLAQKLELSVGHLSLVLKAQGADKRDLTPDNLSKINEILGTDFK